MRGAGLRGAWADIETWTVMERWGKVLVCIGVGLFFQPLAYVLLIKEVGWRGEKVQ